MELQIKSVLKDTEQKQFYIKSDRQDGTFYITWVVQYAEELKKQGKGIAFIGESFAVGLMGDPKAIDMKKLRAAAEATSNKPIKGADKDKVSFKFKEKGKKPINVSGVLDFKIFGNEMSVDKLGETLESMGLQSLD